MKSLILLSICFFITSSAQARTVTECAGFSFSDSPTNGCGGTSLSFLLRACMDDKNTADSLETCKAVSTRSTGAGCHEIVYDTFLTCINPIGGAGDQSIAGACSAAVAEIGFGYDALEKSRAFGSCMNSNQSPTKIGQCAEAVVGLELGYNAFEKANAFAQCL